MENFLLRRPSLFVDVRLGVFMMVEPPHLRALSSFPCIQKRPQLNKEHACYIHLHNCRASRENEPTHRLDNNHSFATINTKCHHRKQLVYTAILPSQLRKPQNIVNPTTVFSFFFSLHLPQPSHLHYILRKPQQIVVRP